MKIWTEEEDLIIKQMYGKETHRDIHKKIPGITKGMLIYRATVLGLKGNIKVVMSKEKSLYTHNRLFFKYPCTLNSYWAGFIAADGNIRKNHNELRISLACKDQGHLERFKADLEFTGNIKVDKRGCANISVSGVEIVDDLRNNFNIVPNKTLILVPPSGLDHFCIMAFILGYIDGDGSISIRTGPSGNCFVVVKTVGTEKMLSFIRNFIEFNFKTLRNKKVVSKVNKYTTVCEYSFSNYRAEQFFIESFKLLVPRLRRKWEPVKVFLNTHKNAKCIYNYYSFNG